MNTAKDAVATMGGILPDDAGGRDAVHVAVFSATSEQKLFAGQDVGLCINEVGAEPKVSTSAPGIGIVDPFLKQPAQPGQRFWVFLYPRTITGLSHRWQHPAFEESSGIYASPAAKIDSEQWLRDYLHDNHGLQYEEVMEVIRNGEFEKDGISARIEGEYIHFYGTSASGDISNEFWEYAEKVLGRKIEKRPSYFSCSC